MGRQWFLAEAEVTTAAGVTSSSPQVTVLLGGDIYVQWVRWRFPPGPAANLGIAFYHKGIQIVPWPGGGTWIWGDDETETAAVGADVFGDLELWTYNSGSFPHAVIVSVQYQPITVTQANSGPPPTPLVNRLYSSEVLGNPEQVTSDSEPALTVAIPAGF